MKKMHLFKVLLLRNNVKVKVAETSSLPQAHDLGMKWKAEHPDCMVAILGSLYTVYEVL
jgi:hypothetical protein